MSSTYEGAGVRDQAAALSAVARHLGPTLGYPDDVEVVTPAGAYAAVLRIAPDLAVAICTDGVGSKTLVASRLDRYDTIGFDCVAMNVNDAICVGARPLALVDYLGVHTLDAGRTEAILDGLGAAAKEAGIAIPGGETAQLPEVIGPGEDAFDLVGTCIGTLRPDDLITGAAVAPGDALIGLASSGIHSNGLTLARKALDARDWTERVADTGRTIGDELLEPTRIYVRAARALWDEGIDTRGLAHITGDGLLNLCRLDADVGYAIESLPAEPPVFDLIRRAGPVDDAEMFRVFNMGIGMVVVVREDEAAATLEIVARAGYAAARLGTVTDEARVVTIPEKGLVGTLESGFASV